MDARVGRGFGFGVERYFGTPGHCEGTAVGDRYLKEMEMIFQSMLGKDQIAYIFLLNGLTTKCIK